MPVLSASDIAAVLDGSLRNPIPGLRFSDFHFDSRQLAEGGLFFALRTDTADGHDYVAQLTNTPGSGAVVEQGFDWRATSLPLILVDDTAAAYRDLASWVRTEYDRTTYIGITGSAGKTTTRDFTYQILKRRHPTHRSEGNWNNWLGLPFSLLKMPAESEFAVFELGMSDPGIGEIDHLSQLLRPRIRCVLNVLPVHLEFLGTITNIARAKLEICHHMAPDDVVLINGDCDPLYDASRQVPGRKVYFGRDSIRNDIILHEVRRNPGRTIIEIDFGGPDRVFEAGELTDAQVENLFAAIVIAAQAGIDLGEIADVTDVIRPGAGRGVVRQHCGMTIIDETYNSNPAAAHKAITWFAAHFPGLKAAVLGDMLELGSDELRFHAEVGTAVAGLDIDLLIAVGERSRAMADAARAAGMGADQIITSADAEEAGSALKERLEPGSAVLFKASRGIHLERAIATLTGE